MSSCINKFSLEEMSKNKGIENVSEEIMAGTFLQTQERKQISWYRKQSVKQTRIRCIIIEMEKFKGKENSKLTIRKKVSVTQGNRA